MIGVITAFLGVLLAGVCIVRFNIPPVILIIVFGVLGVISQIVYARSLNKYLEGVDPVKYGARSLKDLRTVMPIPFFIIILSKLAVLFGFAVLVSVLALFGFYN